MIWVGALIGIIATAPVLYLAIFLLERRRLRG